MQIKLKKILDKDQFLNSEILALLTSTRYTNRGLPRGRVTEIYGPEGSGITTMALHVIAEAQKKGGKCVFIDATPQLH